MRSLSYNILDGGAKREEALARVILVQRPDVVALVEADDPGVVEGLARRLEMDFIHAPGPSHASALLSRLPITSTINHALLREGLEKSLLEAAVLLPGGQELPLGVVHLHAGAFEDDERQREAELEIVLDAFASQRNRPHLLCGDFNANAPHQHIDPQRCKPSTRRAWEANGGHVPRRIVQRLLDCGYVDTLHVVNRAAAERQGTFSTEFPGQRVDYIFAFGLGAGRIKAADIVSDEIARQASDHFPVWAEIESTQLTQHHPDTGKDRALHDNESGD